ncbi:PA2169 family four-helix-bundle protein [Ascidiimonas sp. W6]|uniref:ferritin-like domain-containing protein n=1 Tax=Ascidiimonas meishanensis TaxID=3128903 RepID=UPI0030EB5634
MKYTEKISNKLNELLEKTYDAEKGYKFASDNTNNPELKQFFDDRVKQRYNFGHQLKNEIQAYGQEPEKGGSVKGAVHREWMNLKTAISSNNEEAILEEVARGEQVSIDKYNEILSENNLPASTEAILFAQKNLITASLNRVKTFETVMS